MIERCTVARERAGVVKEKRREREREREKDDCLHSAAINRAIPG